MGKNKEKMTKFFFFKVGSIKKIHLALRRKKKDKKEDYNPGRKIREGS